MLCCRTLFAYAICCCAPILMPTIPLNITGFLSTTRSASANYRNSGGNCSKGLGPETGNKVCLRERLLTLRLLRCLKEEQRETSNAFVLDLPFRYDECRRRFTRGLLQEWRRDGECDPVHSTRQRPVSGAGCDPRMVGPERLGEGRGIEARRSGVRCAR